MSKTFRKQMDAEHRAQRVAELLSCGGDFKVGPKNAIVEDWQHALMQAHTDAVEHMRFLSDPDEDDLHRRCLRKDLARLAAVAEAMAARINRL